MWNKKLVELLLTQYKQHANLYNARDSAYNNRSKRAKSLAAIYECLKPENPNITVNAIKMKIHILRGQYIKETQKIAASRSNCKNEDDVYVPRLWFYPLMGFLSSHTQSRPSTSNWPGKQQLTFNSVYLQDNHEVDNIDDSTDEEAEQESYYFDDSHQSFKSHSSAQSASSHKGKLSTIDAERPVSNVLFETSDYDWLGQQVVFELNNIKDESIRRETAWRIQTILRESVLEDVAKRTNGQVTFCASPTLLNKNVKLE